MNGLKVRIFVVVAVFFTAFLDIASSKRLFGLESNPMILLGLSFWIVAGIKLLVVAIISYQFFLINRYKVFVQFLLCSGIVLLFCMQVFAFYNNLEVEKQYAGQSVPVLSMGEKLGQVKEYMTASLIFFYYPLVVSYLSFITFYFVTNWRMKK